MKKIIERLQEIGKEIVALEAEQAEARRVREEIEVQVAEAEKRLPQLEAERDMLKADVAMGKPKQKTLDTVEAEIGGAQRVVETRQTVTGLLRRETESAAKIRNLDIEATGLKEQAIRLEAENTMQEYMSAANTLLARFKELQALGMFHSTVKGHTAPIASGVEHQYMGIPLFRLEAAGQHPNTSGNWPEWQPARNVHGGIGVDHAVAAAMKERLKKAGIIV